MTERDLTQLERYHRAMAKHHLEMASHYGKRLAELRKAIAVHTSAEVTQKILEKLKSGAQ